MLPQFHVVAPQSNQCPTIPCVDAQLQTFNVCLLNVNYFLWIFNLCELFCATKIWHYTVGVYRGLLTNCLHGKAAELCLTNSWNNSVTNTKYISTLKGLYTAYKLSLAKTDVPAVNQLYSIYYYHVSGKDYFMLHKILCGFITTQPH